jgi:hypothetical protein
VIEHSLNVAPSPSAVIATFSVSIMMAAVEGWRPRGAWSWQPTRGRFTKRQELSGYVSLSGETPMKLAFFIPALALMLCGCVTTQKESASAEVGTNPKVKTDAKPVAKVTPKPRTDIRTPFIDI